MSTPQDMDKKRILPALFVLGFTSITTQLIIIREFLNVFQGNELIVGMIFAVWMLQTALGSKFGKVVAGKPGIEKKLARLFGISSILPILIVIMLYILEAHLFPPGTTKSFGTAFLFSFCLLSPFCLVAGALFTLLAKTFSVGAGENRISEAYGWESLGSLSAGLLFSLLLSRLLDTFQVLALVMLANLFIYSMLNQAIKTRRRIFPAALLWILISVLLFLLPVDRYIKSLHYRDQEVLYTKDTPYGNITVTQTTGQYNFYENGGFLFSSENQVMPEEAVHFALLQHTKPGQIMIVSGGMQGMTAEALKYKSVQHIDYFEINPWLVDAEDRYSQTVRTSRLSVISEDARRWICKTSRRYDAIILNTPDPSNAQINRFYTVDFFVHAKRALRDEGIFSVSLGPTTNYMSTEAKEIHSILYRSLRQVFQNVLVIPGERNYFLASDQVLHLDIAKRSDAAGLSNQFVHSGYLDDDLLRQNSLLIMDEITGGSGKVNSDLIPLAYFLQINYWLSIWQSKAGFMITLLLLLVLLVILLKRTSAVGTGIFAGGFAGASAEFLVIIFYQILYGYVYQMMGIIIAFYMTGLTVGTIMGDRNKKRTSLRLYILLQIILLQLIIFFPFLISVLSQISPIPGWSGQAFLFIMTGLIAYVTGLEFNLATGLEKQKIEHTAGDLYGIDLAGAASGTLLVSLVLFPVAGLFITCLFIALLVLAGMIVAAMADKMVRR